jgi:hypothetical protein
MAGAEGDPRTRNPLIGRVRERLGTLIYPESQRVADEIRRYEKYRNQQIDALLYSSACTAKLEYALGLRDVDPHLDEVIDFNKDHPWPGPYLPNQDSSGAKTNS